MAEAAKEEGAKKKVNVGALLTGAFAVVNLTVLAAGTFMAYSSTIGHTPPAITEQQLTEIHEAQKRSLASIEEQPLIFTMDKMTVNLEGEPKRLIRIEVNVELLNAEGFEEIMDIDRRARARDKVMHLLGSQTFSDIEPIQGKLFLKDRMAQELNSIMDKGVVKGIYFSEFIVQ